MGDGSSQPPEDQASDQDQDQARFRGLYEQYFAFVWRSLNSFGVEAAIREDLAHEVFIVYFKKYMDYQGPAAPSTLLYGIARRVSANHRRGSRRRDAREEQAWEQHAQPGPEDMMARRDAQDLVQRFLDTLSPDNAEIFRLTQIEGLRAKDVAAIFELNLNTLNARVRSAKQKFEAFVRRVCPPEQVVEKGGNRGSAQRGA